MQTLDDLDAVLTEIKQSCGGRSLFLEPGRFIVAQAGVLVARVTRTKGKQHDVLLIASAGAYGLR